jgi:hypothetical protein
MAVAATMKATAAAMQPASRRVFIIGILPRMPDCGTEATERLFTIA